MKLALLVSVLLLTNCGGNSGGSNQNTANMAVPERITFANGGQLGIFDPSIAKDPVSGRLWMSYSAVDTSRYYASDLYWSVSIRLSFSDDSGDTWHDAGVVVAAFTEPIVGGPTMDVTSPAAPIDAGSSGIWQSETSSLVYDPSAPLAERWKLIWFQYLNADLVSYFLDYSWIALKTAATPLELAIATPIKLFGGFGLQADGEITGDPVFSPIGTPPAIQLNTDLTSAAAGTDLNDLDFCVFAEPGLHATNSAIYLSMFCADVSIPDEYVVAFRCLSPCTMTDPADWEYLGRVLTPADAAAIGRDHYQAPAFVTQGNTTYLLATPVDTTSGNRYDGCRAYEFLDLDTGVLLTDGSGQLYEVQRVDGEAGSHNGACTSIDGLNGGIIYSQFEPASAPETFRLYKSQISIP
jgi:hypothetical protein